MVDAGKGVLIIILVIIGIGLVLYLLVNNVRIPAGSWAPFVDGSRIRIRSLLTDEYLFPGTVSDGRLDGAPLLFTTSSGANTVWQLCQNPRSTDKRDQYLLYYNLDPEVICSFYNIDNRAAPIMLRRQSCPIVKQASDKNSSVNRLLSFGCRFHLIEQGGTSSLFGGVASNVYYIRSVTSDKVLTYLSLESPNKQVTMESVGNTISLGQAFVVEVAPMS